MKRQLEAQKDKELNNETDFMKDRQMHIMGNCVINMPISIGLQKNSPLKPTVDKLIRRIIEAGFVKKWLNDVMQPTLNAEIFEESTQTTKALVNLQKLYGAFVALFAGYFLSILVGTIEIIFWNITVKRHPFYNKYSKQIRYPKGYLKQDKFTKKTYKHTCINVFRFSKFWKKLEKYLPQTK